MKRGQIALIVLIVSAVMMTVGLSISKRAVVETKVDSDEEALKQAFNAAEGGIEYFLKTGQTTFNSGDQKSSAEITTETLGGGTTVNYSEFTTMNSPVFYWLRAHNPDGTINYGSGFNGTDLRVCVSNTFTGAIKVDYFYRTAANAYLVWRNGYNFGTINTVNGYEDATAAGACSGRANAKEVVLNFPYGATNTPLLLAVKPLFGGDYISVKTADVSASFPVQGLSVSSVGRVGEVGAQAGAGATTGSSQVIKVKTGYEVFGFMLDAVNAEGSVLSN